MQKKSTKRRKAPKKSGVINKTVTLEKSLVSDVEKRKSTPGQNFKWSPYIAHLVALDVAKSN